MAKKKTKKTPKSASREAASSTSDALRDAETKTAEKRAELAAERSVCWLQLFAKLDEIQADALEYFRFGRRCSDAEIDAELARHPNRYRHGREDAEWGLQHVDRWRLSCDVQKLARRLPAIGFEHVDEPGRKSIGDLLRACQDKSFAPEGGFYELVARAMRVVQTVAAVDAELSRGFEKIPDPLGLEVLGQIEKKPGTAKEIAQALAPRDRPDLADTRKVQRAIERLEKIGFELVRIPGHGYALSPSDRARLARIDRGI
jgi:hypothetical protein